MESHDHVNLAIHYCSNERLPVAEIMAQLRAADRFQLTYFAKAESGRAVGEQNLCGRTQDSLPRRASFLSELVTLG